MKRFCFAVVAAAFAFAVMSCASSGKTPCEPVSDDDTLAAGRVVFKIKGNDCGNGIDISGTHTHGVTLQVYDLTQYAYIECKTIRNGIFLIKGAVPGHAYQIKRIVYRREKDDGSFAQFTYDGLDYDLKEIHAGKVNIVCDLEIVAVKGSDTGSNDSDWGARQRITSFMTNYRWHEVNDTGGFMDAFESAFPRTAWNQFEYYY